MGIRAMTQFNIQQTSGARQVGLAVCTGRLFKTDPVGGTSTPTTPATTALTGTYRIQNAATTTDWYLVGRPDVYDGMVRMNFDANTWAYWQPVIRDTAPPYTPTVVMTGIKLVAAWRARLVICDGYIVWFSRVGKYDDDPPTLGWELTKAWDTSLEDEAASWATSLGSGSKLNDQILALIPLSDDRMLFGCDHTFSIMIGDPRAGGSIQPISDGIGIMGTNSWCSDPNGNAYVLCSDGCLYHFSRDGGMKNLTLESIPKYFQGVSRDSHQIEMAYNADEHVVRVCCTPLLIGGTAVNLDYYVETDGAFPLAVPARIQPFVLCVYDADSPGNRLVLHGGQDGYIYSQYSSATNDDGDVINAYATFSPMRPGGDTDNAKLVQVHTILGENPLGFIDSDWRMTLTLQAGKDAYSAIHVPYQTRTASFLTPGRQTNQGFRISARDFVLKVSDNTLDKIFAVDSVTGLFEPAGRTR